uniref:Helicase ATP-binding domain-containing protein n=1 Tax=Trichuris muris TaxID=70415 RepID=A0A5S6Q3V9_TRIMR
MKMTCFDDDEEFEKLLVENEELKHICDTAVARSVPRDFGCLFEPYECQKNFMRTLYAVLSNGNVAVMESPTGTGKSLSLLCGSLTWLRDARQQMELDLQSAIQKNNAEIQHADSSNWLEEYDRKMEAQIIVDTASDRLDKIHAAQRRMEQVKATLNELAPYGSNRHKRRKAVQLTCGLDQLENEDDLDNVLLDEHADEDDRQEKVLEDEASDVYRVAPQVLYCSRTHSQLAQFAKEIQKTVYARSVHMVTIASRQSLCVNDSVARLKNPVLINERCLQLQDSTFKKRNGENGSASRNKCSCPFLRQEGIQQLAEEALCIGDIEEVIQRGREIQACPYYASRNAVKLADIILMPYQVLMQKDTRETFDLSLAENVVIVDEAHNLLETIESVHGFEISSDHLSRAQAALDSYVGKFRGRFSAKTLMHLQQLRTLIDSSARCLSTDGGVPFRQTDDRCFSMSDFITHVGIEAINCFVLASFVDKSGLCRKMRGFLKAKQVEGNEVMENVFYSIRSYIACLTNRIGDGRFLIKKRSTTESCKVIKFILLNPAVYFKDVLTEAKAVVLTGGTMEPVGELYNRLFIPAGVPATKVTRFSCNHVVPHSNILPLVIATGSHGRKLEFTYNMRKTPQLLDELCQTILQLCAIAPAGLVCFFPSYEYERCVSEHLEKSGILAQLQASKPLFREPRKANETGVLLLNYANAVSHSGGAILFAVVGGKMSEGINFADGLCRCVVMVGMPYPNHHSVELQERMNYLNSSFNAGRTQIKKRGVSCHLGYDI